MIGANGHVPIEVEGLGLDGPGTVSFPLEQPGISALVGFYEADGRPYVIKLPKTEEVQRWALGGHSVREPLKVKAMRRASRRWNSLGPTRSAWQTIEGFNSLCQRCLGAIDRRFAEEALMGVRGAEAGAVARLLDELYRDRGELHFAPAVSRTTWVKIPALGPESAFAMIQEQIDSGGSPAKPFVRSLPRRESNPRTRSLELEFLALLACASSLARQHGLGLDLVPSLRWGQFSMPNVLVRGDSSGLVYIDYFGFAQRAGNTVEQAAFRALYGRWGTTSQLSAWIYRGLTR